MGEGGGCGFISMHFKVLRYKIGIFLRLLRFQIRFGVCLLFYLILCINYYYYYLLFYFLFIYSFIYLFILFLFFFWGGGGG